MTLYLDTSAFVKLILDEEGSAEARKWLIGGRPSASSVVTYPEACSALGRRSHGLATREQLNGWREALKARWNQILSIRVDAVLAGDLALRHRLRGMDAIQLAAAVRTRERLQYEGASRTLHFATFDRRLLEAAEREGFATLGGPLR